MSDEQPKRYRLRNLKLHRISAVTVPAQEGAQAAIVKGASTVMWSRVSKADTTDDDTDVIASMKTAPTCKACGAAMDADAYGKSAMCAKCADAAKNASANSPSRPNDTETTMTDQDKADKAALETRVAKAEKMAADSTAQAALDKAAMEARLAKAEKIAEESAAQLSIEKAAREAVELEKRADVEIPNLKGTAKERAALVKAVDGISDPAVREVCREALKGASDMMKTLTQPAGHGGGGAVHGDARSAFEAGLVEFAKAAGKAKEFATSDFLLTEKGADLYAAAYPRTGN